MPPSAFSHFTANCMLGVGQTPRSTTSQPAASSPAITAERIIGPEGRVSRQTRIRPRSRYVPNASENSTASSGVNVSPTMPRTPVMPIFSGFIGDLIVPHDISSRQCFFATKGTKKPKRCILSPMKRLLLVVLAILTLLPVAVARNQDTQKTIAERLGYPRDAKLLIVHADDLGMTHS